MSIAENIPLAPERDWVAEAEAPEIARIPITAANGNSKIAILKHSLAVRTLIEDYTTPLGVNLAIRNVSDTMIATAIFEVVYYGADGNILETVKAAEIALEPKTSRGIHIPCSLHLYDNIQSYVVRIVRMTTADVERVQLRRHETTTTESGEEEIMGIVKNISQIKTDAAVVATFFDAQHEIIGTKVVVLRDLEPNSIREYQLRYKPPEGDSVDSYTLRIGEIAG